MTPQAAQRLPDRVTRVDEADVTSSVDATGERDLRSERGSEERGEIAVFGRGAAAHQRDAQRPIPRFTALRRRSSCTGSSICRTRQS